MEEWQSWNYLKQLVFLFVSCDFVSVIPVSPSLSAPMEEPFLENVLISSLQLVLILVLVIVGCPWLYACGSALFPWIWRFCCLLEFFFLFVWWRRSLQPSIFWTHLKTAQVGSPATVLQQMLLFPVSVVKGYRSTFVLFCFHFKSSKALRKNFYERNGTKKTKELEKNVGRLWVRNIWSLQKIPSLIDWLIHWLIDFNHCSQYDKKVT